MAATGGGGGKRGMNYATLLLLAFVAAFLSVLMLQKLRERRVLGLMVQEQQQQLLTLELHLQKEKDQSKELKNRLEELRGKTISMVNQKTELNSKLMETKTIVSSLETKQKEMESALEEKENKINGMTKKAAGSPNVDQNHQVTTLIQLLNQKEAEIDEMKRRLRLIDDNPAEKNTVRNSKDEYFKSQDGPQEMSTNHGNGEPSEERKVRDEAANEHENTPKTRNWVQIEEDDDEIEGDRDQTATDSEKLGFPNKTRPDEEQITETKVRKDIENVEPERREEEEIQSNNYIETEKPDSSLRKTARRVTVETDNVKLKIREGKMTESSQSKFLQESERDQDHKMVSEEEKDIKNAEIISNSEGKISETSSQSKFHQDSGKDEHHKMESEEDKDVKNVELISRTDNSQNTEMEANERQSTKDAQSEKPHYPLLANKVSADAKFGVRAQRALPKTRHARRIKRSSRRQHLLKKETSQRDENQMNRTNQHLTNVGGSGSHMENKEIRDLPIMRMRKLKGLTSSRIMMFPKKYFSETANRIINKRATVPTATN